MCDIEIRRVYIANESGMVLSTIYHTNKFICIFRLLFWCGEGSCSMWYEWLLLFSVYHLEWLYKIMLYKRVHVSFVFLWEKYFLQVVNSFFLCFFRNESCLLVEHIYIFLRLYFYGRVFLTSKVWEIKSLLEVELWWWFFTVFCSYIYFTFRSQFWMLPCNKLKRFLKFIYWCKSIDDFKLPF